MKWVWLKIQLILCLWTVYQIHTIELVQVQYVNKYTDTFDRSQRRLNNTTSQSSVKRQRDENKTITNYVHIS